MQTKNIYLQIANECCLSLKLISFVFLVELNRSKSSRLKQTESDVTNGLDIFGSFILSVKEIVQNLAFCKHSCKHKCKEQKRD